MKYVAQSDIGAFRNFNEDAIALPQSLLPGCLPEVVPERGTLFLLADGMGGAPAGSVASNLAVRQVMHSFYQLVGTEDIEQRLVGILEETNHHLYDMSEVNPELTGMSTTILAAAFEREQLFAATVGDSRIYRLREEQLEQLSEDQSVVWELYRQGIISKDELRTHPRKNLLSQSLGTHFGVEVLSFSHPTRPGDLYLMCSDGLTDYVPETDIAQLLCNGAVLDDKLQNLLAAARRLQSHDNTTVILCQL